MVHVSIRNIEDYFVQNLSVLHCGFNAIGLHLSNTLLGVHT